MFEDAGADKRGEQEGGGDGPGVEREAEGLFGWFRHQAISLCMAGVMWGPTFSARFAA